MTKLTPTDPFTLTEMFDHVVERAKGRIEQTGQHPPTLFTGSVRHGKLAGPTIILPLGGYGERFRNVAAEIMDKFGGDFMIVVMAATMTTIKDEALTPEEKAQMMGPNGQLTDEIRAKAAKTDDCLLVACFGDEFSKDYTGIFERTKDSPDGKSYAFTEDRHNENAKGAWDDIWQRHKKRLIRFDYTSDTAIQKLSEEFKLHAPPGVDVNT